MVEHASIGIDESHLGGMLKFVAPIIGILNQVEVEYCPRFVYVSLEDIQSDLEGAFRASLDVLYVSEDIQSKRPKDIPPQTAPWSLCV